MLLLPSVRIDHQTAVVPHQVVALAARTQQLYLLVHPQYLLPPSGTGASGPTAAGVGANVVTAVSTSAGVVAAVAAVAAVAVVAGDADPPLVPLLTFAVFRHPMGCAEWGGLNEVNEGPRGVHSAHQESGLLSWPLQGVRPLHWVASLLVMCARVHVHVLKMLKMRLDSSWYARI